MMKIVSNEIQSNMKKTLLNFCTSWAMILVAVCGMLSSCELVQKSGDFSVTFKGVGPGYVSVMATVPAPTEVAYIVDKEPLAHLNASLIFMTGDKVTFNSDGEQQLLAEIEAETKYYLYLVARLSASEFSEVYSFEFNSGAFSFSELCSVVAVMPDGYKMHITVPESVKKSEYGKPGSRAIRYTQADLMFYNVNRKNYDEYYMLLHNNQMHVSDDTTLEFSEANNYTQSSEDLDEDGDVDEDDLTYKWNPISPGEPVVFLAGEFEWMQMPKEYESGGELEDDNYYADGWLYPAGWAPGYYRPMIDGAKYDEYYATKASTRGMNIITDIDVSHELDHIWTGAFQKKLFRTRVPEKLAGNVAVEVLEVGPVDATLAFTPDSDVQFYSVAILDEGTFGEMLELLDNKEEYLQWATASFFAMYNFGTRIFYEPAEVVLSDHFYDVPADTKYHVLVTGMGDQAGSTQCFNHFTFNTPPKTKNQGPKIEVEALEDESSPFHAKFRIKCTSPENPAKRCYYGANYVKDWIYAVNSGGTYLSYGQQAQFTKAELEEINSDAGLIVDFPTIDGETTRLVVVAFNDENTPNDLNYEDITECPAVADLTTPFHEADVCASYFNLVDKLAGEWTMSATVLDAEGNKVNAVKNVSILDEYVNYPATLDKGVYDIYHEHTKWTDDEINAYWEEFKENAKMFNTKRLANQNKLALVGWLDGGVYGAYETLLPYDLFISETINTVDVKSMFSDFGPKMYLEVAEDSTGRAKITITGDMMFGNPVMNWSDPFYLAGRADATTNNTIFYYADQTTGQYAAPLVFDVEYSADFNTLTIKGIEGNGATYYPNVIGQDSQTGRYMLDYPVVSDVVLTRGYAASETAIKAAKNVSVVPMNADLNISHKQYTRFDRPVKRVKAEMEVMTLEKAHANYAKYIRLMEKRNK